MLVITGFKSNEGEEASARYAEAEKLARDGRGKDAVLVSVDSVDALERAYPNYFADTRMFIELLKQALSGHQRGIFVRPRKIEASAVLEGSSSLKAEAVVKERSS